MRAARRRPDGDLDLVRLAARRLSLQATAMVALAVLVLVGVTTVLVLREQNASAQSLLVQATAHADDVNDPPAGTWLVIRTTQGVHATQGIPAGFPDRAALNDVARTRQTRMATVQHGASEYLVRTAPHGRATVQGVLDLAPQHRQRADLVQILLAVGAMGLLLSGFVGTLMARRAVRPLSEAMLLQRSFIADASHELRTPLTLLSTRAQILRRSLAAAGVDPAVVGDAAGVVADAARMTEVVEELLVSAEPRTQQETAAIDLVPLCADLVDSARDYAATAGVDLSLGRPGHGQVLTWGNAAGVRRALLAILDNAITHTPPAGAVTVTVGLQGRTAVIDVVDTGGGIEPTDVGRVFDRFHSGTHRANRRSYGLGLALARDVITRQGGQVSVETTSPSGTTFRVRLPCVRRSV